MALPTQSVVCTQDGPAFEAAVVPVDFPLATAVRAAITDARAAQGRWAATSVKQRLTVAKRWRHLVAQHAHALAKTVNHLVYRRLADTLVAEVLPLADAGRFLEQEAPRLLAPRRCGTRGRPMWLRGVTVEVHREPHGVILIIGPRNYPLFLPGVQALQALVAGNAVLIKPGVEGTASARAVRDLWVQAGLDPRLYGVLPEPPEAARVASSSGIDKVLLTGSGTTGTAVLHDLATEVIPAVCELSGCDAVFVQPDADLELVTAALKFGLQFNGSETCIAPRRIFVHRPLLPELERRLSCLTLDCAARPLPSHIAPLITHAVAEGARVLGGHLQQNLEYAPLVLSNAAPTMPLLQTDIGAPVLALVPVQGDDDALAAAAHCPYALGAAVFGRPQAARAFAQRVQAGVVVVNDVIVPTADPRLPFSGRRRSGFGVTRGAEGLLELTVLKAIAVRQGRWYPHYEPPSPEDVALFRTYIEYSHGGTWGVRLRGVMGLLHAMRRRLANHDTELQRTHDEDNRY